MNRDRRATYASLWFFALAFGWIEASVVVYLREIAARENALHATNYFQNLPVSLVSLPGTLVALEMAREACTLVVLGVVGWVAARRAAERIGAFLLAFGIWDITYYAVLRLVSGWPASITTWDILFLIPSPWVAPVWAPVTIATLFVLAGSYLFWTVDRERRYRRGDIGVLVAATGLTLAAFLAGSNAVIDHRLPERFPFVVFWSGVMLGLAWFAAVERRESVATERRRRPWLGGRVRTLAPAHVAVPSTTWSRLAGGDAAVVEPHEESDVGPIVAQYRDVKNRLDGLMGEAREFAERLERLSHGLSTRPGHLIVGLPAENLEHPSEWEIVPSHPLPSIGQLTALTNDIRAESARLQELRERLILMGHPDLMDQPNEFFQ